jgi:hypothetical protein
MDIICVPDTQASTDEFTRRQHPEHRHPQRGEKLRSQNMSLHSDNTEDRNMAQNIDPGKIYAFHMKLFCLNIVTRYKEAVIYGSVKCGIWSVVLQWLTWRVGSVSPCKVGIQANTFSVYSATNSLFLLCALLIVMLQAQYTNGLSDR